MSFKDISFLELWSPLCSVECNHLCNFGRRHHEELFREIIFDLDQWFRRRCRLKIFLYRALVASSCSAKWNYLCNLGRGYHEEQFCEIILNLDHWLRRCHLNDFLSRALAALMLGGVEPFMQFW